MERLVLVRLDKRVRLRRMRAGPILHDLKSWLFAERPGISGNSELVKAIRYALDRMRKLRPYVEHGCLERTTTRRNGR